ncbi:MAG: acylneuraminate cytidylyltransferase family protein [Ramlibacter sp.]|nr:acylneuraminate cytidylyltransferase family protein [Ramlibacter sp.]
MTASITVATICARGGSKGLPGKNLRDLQGLPLIVHSIRHAQACAGLSGVYVSTDDPAIAQVARSAGAIVPFLRPAELATDEAPKLPALENLVGWIEANVAPVQRLVDLQPTSPLRTPQDIESAMGAAPDAGLVVSVCEARDNPYFNLVEPAPDGGVTLCKGVGSGRRQDVPPVYALNGSIYVWHRPALALAARQGLWSVPRIGIHVMPRHRSVDIDDLDDFEYARWLLEKQESKAP